MNKLAVIVMVAMTLAAIGPGSGGVALAEAPTDVGPSLGPFVTPEAWQTIQYQNFEALFPSGKWSVSDVSSDSFERYWDDQAYNPHGGAQSVWPASGGVNGLDPASNPYPANMNTWMVYGPFDLSDALDAQTVFWLWRDIYDVGDYLFFGVSADGITYDGIDLSGQEDWTEFIYPLTGYVGDATVWVGWNFFSDGDVALAGPFVDDITISKQLPNPPPAPVVAASRSGSDVVLGWSAVLGATGYEVWWGVNTPTFTPGADCAAAPISCAVVTTPSYTHAGAIGSAANNHFYVVLAVNAGGRSVVSNRVGEFDFALTRGN